MTTVDAVTAAATVNVLSSRCGRPRGAEDVKRMAKELGVSIPQLLVLHRTNDPFMTGTETDWRRGRWFANRWPFTASQPGHARRKHYECVSVEDVLWNGEPYVNTDRCWNELCKAAANARALGLVDPSSFVDRKNADPVLFAGDPRPEAFEPWVEWEPGYFRLPEIDATIGYPRIDLGRMLVEGYDHQQGDQPALLEVWVEKSTMNDVLEPVCDELGINLVVSSGFQSITNAVGLLQRSHSFRHPARLFYVSDFDPAGDSMPVALSRQVEFWQPRFAPHGDLKITPLAMTRDLVGRFDLPRTPIKENDARRAGFEARRGQGCVELDALEALHPGELARLLRDAAKPYRDHTLRSRLHEAAAEADTVANDAWRAATAPLAARVERITVQTASIADRYEDRLRALSEELAAEIAPFQAEADEVRGQVEAMVDDFSCALPQRPEGEIGDVDEDAWLYSSGRSYLGQLHVYREHHSGGEVPE